MNNCKKYKRILIKLSGESFGNNNLLYDSEMLRRVAVGIVESIKTCKLEIGIVVGAGNIWRGCEHNDIDNIKSDYIGMLGTAINTLLIGSMFEQLGARCVMQSSINMHPCIDMFNRNNADEALSNGKIVIFACGTGHPFFTTDTAAALRASEVGADLLLKATKVDGVYSKDPISLHEKVEKYNNISFDKMLSMNLQVIDSTALQICKSNKIPIMILNFMNLDKLYNIFHGNNKELFTMIS
jgi:uridylate kinase